MEREILNDSQTDNSDTSFVNASAVMKDVNTLRETLEMIEWCLSGNSKNVELFVKDLPRNMNSILKHFSDLTINHTTQQQL